MITYESFMFFVFSNTLSLGMIPGRFVTIRVRGWEGGGFEFFMVGLMDF